MFCLWYSKLTLPLSLFALSTRFPTKSDGIRSSQFVPNSALQLEHGVTNSACAVFLVKDHNDWSPALCLSIYKASQNLDFKNTLPRLTSWSHGSVIRGKSPRSQRTTEYWLIIQPRWRKLFSKEPQNTQYYSIRGPFACFRVLTQLSIYNRALSWPETPCQANRKAQRWIE